MRSKLYKKDNIMTFFLPKNYTFTLKVWKESTFLHTYETQLNKLFEAFNLKARHRCLLRFWPKSKIQKNVPAKASIFSNTYGYAKSRGPKKSWGPPAYLGDLGSRRPKIGPYGQKSIRRPREMNKATFPHVFKPWVWILQKILKFLF